MLALRRAPLALARGLVWQVRHPLDAAAMQRGADFLLGRHDFTTFRAAMCQAKSPVKSLDEITIEQRAIPNGQVIEIHLRARSFLHNQVRSITGSLERVGAGAWHPDQMALALRACDRAACGPVAPPDGLFLTGVGYPKDIFAA